MEMSHVRVAVASLVLAAGCAAAPQPDTAWPTPDGPNDPAAELRPDLIIAPESAHPGAVVRLVFPEETPRGVHFVLESSGDWQLVYHLVSDANGGQPSYFRPGATGIGVPAVGIGGAGPDRVQVPPDVQPGEYRICTANAGENFCAPIEIVAP
jgi:hypothetical protein